MKTPEYAGCNGGSISISAAEAHERAGNIVLYCGANSTSVTHINPYQPHQNCRNCGAPTTPNGCEYCGTDRVKQSSYTLRILREAKRGVRRV